jgi:hypothetical protein
MTKHEHSDTAGRSGGFKRAVLLVAGDTLADAGEIFRMGNRLECLAR